MQKSLLLSPDLLAGIGGKVCVDVDKPQKNRSVYKNTKIASVTFLMTRGHGTRMENNIIAVEKQPFHLANNDCEEELEDDDDLKIMSKKQYCRSPDSSLSKLDNL